MNILITNDDGWGSQGILALTDIMRQLGHVTVLAPDGPRSGFSNAISSTKLITLKKVIDPAREDVDIYITSGTPSDCVKIALNIIFKGDESAIDLIVSGINHGSNASINAIYSGTIGACLIGAEHNIRAIGFSIYDNNTTTDLSHFLPYIRPITEELLNREWPAGMCYNINAPVGPIEGVQWARQCRGHWADEIAPKGVAEDGSTLYGLVGYYVNDEPDATDTDEYALHHGFISIQPCTPDMTFYPAL